MFEPLSIESNHTMWTIVYWSHIEATHTLLRNIFGSELFEYMSLDKNLVILKVQLNNLERSLQKVLDNQYLYYIVGFK